MAGGQFGTSQVQLPLLEHIPAEFSRAAADVAADGFAVVRGFLGPEEMARVLAEVAAFERLVLPALPPHRAFFSDPDDLASLRFVGIASRIAQVPDVVILCHSNSQTHGRAMDWTFIGLHPCSATCGIQFHTEMQSFYY